MVWLYPTVKKFDDMFSRLDTIPACDRRKAPQTDGQIYCDSIVCAMHTHRALKKLSDHNGLHEVRFRAAVVRCSPLWGLLR